MSAVLAGYCGLRFRNFRIFRTVQNGGGGFALWFHATAYCHQEAVHLLPCCSCGLAPSLTTALGFFSLLAERSQLANMVKDILFSSLT